MLVNIILFLYSFGYDDSPTALGHVDCVNNSLSVLLQCSSTINYDSFCSNNYDVTVSCCECVNENFITLVP